jgi:hypothetical protein
MVGVLECIVFFYVGVWGPHRVKAAYEQSSAPMWESMHTLLDKLSTAKSQEQVDEVSQVLDPLMKTKVEMDKQEEKDPSARENYLLGLAIPILVLGVCAFATSTKRDAVRMPSENDMT